MVTIGEYIAPDLEKFNRAMNNNSINGKKRKQQKKGGVNAAKNTAKKQKSVLSDCSKA